MKWIIPELAKMEKFEEHYVDLADILYNQYVDKNSAYGNSMSKNYDRFGKVVYAIRISDKLNRLETLLLNPDLDYGDETVYDTIGDAITYCMMGIGDLIVNNMLPNDIVHVVDGIRETYLNQAFTEELLVDIQANPGIITHLLSTVNGEEVDFDSMIDYIQNDIYEEAATSLYALAAYLFCLYAAISSDMHIEITK